MKAIYYLEYGSADVLRYGEQPTPEPRADELLLRVHASSINPVDWKIRRGELKLVSGFGFPQIPGRDVAGVVERVGAAVQEFRPGDRVFGMVDSLGGANAEYVVLPARVAAALPPNLSFEQAAALPLAGLTALQALRDKGALRAGERVLINGASGGVGTLAVQLARLLGAGSVVATCGARNVGLVRGLGADEVIDYAAHDFTQDHGRYDLIFDAVAHSSYRQSKAALRSGGRYVTTVPNPKDLALGLPLSVFSDKKLRIVVTKDRGPDMRQLAQWLGLGRLRPVIDTAFPLADTAAAHRYSEQGHAAGKIVLTVA
ncbi:NAD(P)-dependent alcohol dehydrogenase [Hymenobacter jeollabukensis]|uniref:NAD(P)-dependent alcohol dehydrogenase n=1 Tax=Hymenobacter jeollabukensis TaxID=2025313 RepID=A0A5R8WY06_9BACT|nr:NAD(P)-dependent alcohol dehydrogenase [Hymenobacter jeollabukensis]TLM97092.1 NAD(P)-dependent alcohol dehydrogenase [Hymenobacter jeollabukensis]